MTIVAIIPARGGSKGIPRKNLKEFCGKPLIAHILRTALKVEELDRIIVSTEDKEIAEVAKKYGAEVPFLRPEELAKDETPTLPVLQHTVKFLEETEGYVPDVVVLLYATSPLLKPERISDAIKMIKNGNFDSVLSVVENLGHFWTKEDNHYVRLYPKNVENRQLSKPLFKENGAIYVSKKDILGNNQIIGGKVGFLKMLENESIDLDEQTDFDFAEFLMKKRNEKNQD